MTRSEKSKLDRHQKIKFKIKFKLVITDSCHENVRKIVTRGLKSRLFIVYFVHISMGPIISGVRPYDPDVSRGVG